MVNQFRASVDRTGIHRFDSNFVASCDLGVQNVYCGYVPHQSTFGIGTAGVTALPLDLAPVARRRRTARPISSITT